MKGVASGSRALVSVGLCLLVGLFAAVSSGIAAKTANGLPVREATEDLSSRVFWSGLALTSWNREHPSRLTVDQQGTASLTALTEIRWQEWGAPVAHGTAIAIHEDNSRPRVGVAVLLTMSGIQACDGAQIYTNLAIAISPENQAPTDWVTSGGLRGEVHSCWPLGGCKEAAAACTMPAQFSPKMRFRFQAQRKAWVMPLPWLHSAAWHVSLSGWGTPTATGRGLVVRCEFHDADRVTCSRQVYAARFAFTNPRFCTERMAQGAYYTSMRVRLYGHGKLLPVTSRRGVFAPPPKSYDKLLRHATGTPSAQVSSSLLTVANERHELLDFGCAA